MFGKIVGFLGAKLDQGFTGSKLDFPSFFLINIIRVAGRLRVLVLGVAFAELASGGSSGEDGCNRCEANFYSHADEDFAALRNASGRLSRPVVRSEKVGARAACCVSGHRHRP